MGVKDTKGGFYTIAASGRVDEPFVGVFILKVAEVSSFEYLDDAIAEPNWIEQLLVP